MADDATLLAKLEFSILRYRNGKGSFTALVSALDGCTARIGNESPYRLELRSRWLDLEEISRASPHSGSAEPRGEHRRQAELVLDELLDLARIHR